MQIEKILHPMIEPTLPPHKPKSKTKTLPGCLTAEMQDDIKAKVMSRGDGLPKDKAAKAIIQGWSAIKAKFGKGYKEVAEEDYLEVVSLLARLPIDGAPQAIGYHAPLSAWQPQNQKGSTGWLTYPELSQVEAHQRPLAKLLTQLAQDGHDVAGAEAEYAAMKLLLSSFYWKLDTLRQVVASLDQNGLRVSL